MIWKAIVFGFVAALVAVALYVRFAPLHAQRWHDAELPQLALGKYPKTGGYAEVRLVEEGRSALRSLDEIIRATPRTVAMAGSVEEGRVTYVTRSALWRFPDYTVVQIKEGPDGTSALHIQGHLRFGRSDMGVNRARIQGWLAQLDAVA